MKRMSFDERSNAKVLSEAISTFGTSAQIEMIIEECSELIQALQKHKRNPTNLSYEHVCEELADVEIVIAQGRKIFDDEKIDTWKNYKIDRLSKRIIDAHATQDTQE